MTLKYTGLNRSECTFSEDEIAKINEDVLCAKIDLKAANFHVQIFDGLLEVLLVHDLRDLLHKSRNDERTSVDCGFFSLHLDLGPWHE